MKMQCWFAVKGKETSARTKGQTEPVAIAENKNSTRFHWDIWRGLQRLSLNFSFAKMERKSSLFLRQGMENIHCVSSFLSKKTFSRAKNIGELCWQLFACSRRFILLLFLMSCCCCCCLCHTMGKRAHTQCKTIFTFFYLVQSSQLYFFLENSRFFVVKMSIIGSSSVKTLAVKKGFEKWLVRVAGSKEPFFSRIEKK